VGSQVAVGKFHPFALCRYRRRFHTNPIKQNYAVTATSIFTDAVAIVAPAKKLLLAKKKREKHEDERIPVPALLPILENKHSDWELLEPKKEKACASWMAMFERSKKFKEANGHCWISTKKSAVTLDGDRLGGRRRRKTVIFLYFDAEHTGTDDQLVRDVDRCRDDATKYNVATLNLEPRIEMLSRSGSYGSFNRSNYGRHMTNSWT